MWLIHKFVLVPNFQKQKYFLSRTDSNVRLAGYNWNTWMSLHLFHSLHVVLLIYFTLNKMNSDRNGTMTIYRCTECSHYMLAPYVDRLSQFYMLHIHKRGYHLSRTSVNRVNSGNWFTVLKGDNYVMVSVMPASSKAFRVYKIIMKDSH